MRCSISTLGDRFLEGSSVRATDLENLVPEVHLFRFKSGDEGGVDGLAPVDPHDAVVGHFVGEFTQGSSGDQDTLDSMYFGVNAVALEVSDVPDVHPLPFAAYVDEDVRSLFLLLVPLQVGLEWAGY